MKLTEDIQKTLEEWKSPLQSCDFIFLFAPSFNSRIFFDGFFAKNDTRIRGIPFTTKRPSFVECKRIQKMLTTVEFLEKRENPIKEIETTKNEKKKKKKKKSLDPKIEIENNREQVEKEKIEFENSDRFLKAVKSGKTEDLNSAILDEKIFLIPENLNSQSISYPLYLAVESLNFEMVKYKLWLFAVFLK